MKNILTILASVCLLTVSAGAEEKQLYSAGEWQAEAFALTTTPDFEEFTGGYGAGVAYFWHQNFGASIRTEAAGWDLEGNAVDAGSAAIVGRLPLGAFAPYGRIAFGHSWTRERCYIETGVGAELRFGNGNVGAWAEAQVRSDFGGRAVYAGLAGVRFSF